MQFINKNTGRDATRQAIDIIKKSLEESGYTFVNTEVHINIDGCNITQLNTKK